MQAVLAAAQRAGDDRELAHFGPAFEVFLCHIGEWANHHVITAVAHQFGRHGFELAAIKHVQEKGLQDVIAVVTQRDFVATQFARHAVQNAATQARAQAAHGFAFGNFFFHDRVRVLRFDAELHTYLRQVFGQHIGRKTGLLLVEVDRNQLKADGRTLLHHEQDVEHGVAVFATGHADHDLVAFFDHVVVDDGLAHLAAQALFELVVLVLDLDLLNVFVDVFFCCCRHRYHHCPVSMRMATSQSSKISSLAIFTRTPNTPGNCMRR